MENNNDLVEGEGEGEGEVMDPVVAAENLLKAVKENDEETALGYLENKDINALYEDAEKWSPLMWACCNGNEKLVNILLNDFNAASPYITNKEDENFEQEGGNNPFKKPKIASMVGRYTPMHWASYKGNYRIVWKLLKEGMSPLDIDIYGNTAVHQAAASGKIEVLECFLSRGVDVEMKNARGHTSFDLATDDKVRDVIKKAIETTNCIQCGSVFDFKNIRYLCISCKNFYCSKCSKTNWEFETAESEEMEKKPVCRSLKCEDRKKKGEKKLRESMESMHYETLDTAFNELQYDKKDFDVKLVKAAEVLHLKLQKEKGINEFIDSLKFVENYKTIKKSVHLLEDLVTEARKLDVDLDPDIVSRVNNESARLIAERNLQFQMEKVNVSESTHEDVKVLEDLIQIAKATGVASMYTDKADINSDKMSRNIRAREILDLLEQYPPREYPEEPEPDPKNKGKAAPPPPKKKKKKKEPPFPMPEWAKELQTVIDEVNNLKTLLGDKANLELTDEFESRCGVMFERFKKEIAFRKDQEEQERLAAEAKKNKKNAKKK